MSVVSLSRTPEYRITLFYGPEALDGEPPRLHCVFNVKKRSWKSGVQVGVELMESQLEGAKSAAAFDHWLERITGGIAEDERQDYEGRARDLFAQALCALKLDLALEAGLRQESQSLAGGAFARELDETVHRHMDRIKSSLLEELDLVG